MEILILFLGLVLFAGTIIQQGEPGRSSVEVRRRTRR